MGAVTLNYAMPGFIDRHGVCADALDKQMDMLRKRYNATPLQGGQFFRTAQARAGKYKESDFGTGVELPRISEDSAKMPYVTPAPGYPKEFTVQTYRAAIKVERAVTEDELFPVAKQMQSGLMRSGRLLLEYQMANVFNNATSASYVGGDGVALAASTHKHERAETGTWSNLETASALTWTSFSTARKNMRKRTDEFGYPMSIMPKTLVVPPDLEGVARQLKTTEKTPGNNLNDMNVWANDNWSVMVYDYLTSTTAWLLWGDMPMENCGLLYVVAAPPSIAPLEGGDMSTDIIWGQRLRMRTAVGFRDGKNIQYNAGA